MARRRSWRPTPTPKGRRGNRVHRRPRSSDRPGSWLRLPKERPLGPGPSPTGARGAPSRSHRLPRERRATVSSPPAGSDVRRNPKQDPEGPAPSSRVPPDPMGSGTGSNWVGGSPGGRQAGLRAFPGATSPAASRGGCSVPRSSTTRHVHRSGRVGQSQPYAPVAETTDLSGRPGCRVGSSTGCHALVESAPARRRERGSLELSVPSEHQRLGIGSVWPSPIRLQPCYGPEGPSGS